MESFKSEAPEALGVCVDVAFMDWLLDRRYYARKRAASKVSISFRTHPHWSFFTP